MNELKVIESQLTDADSTLKSIDIVILSLGTNDCKACFDSLQSEVPNNMKKVIDYVKTFPYSNGKTPRIIWLMPPQVAPDSMLITRVRLKLTSSDFIKMLIYKANSFCIASYGRRI